MLDAQAWRGGVRVFCNQAPPRRYSSVGGAFVPRLWLRICIREKLMKKAALAQGLVVSVCACHAWGQSSVTALPFSAKGLSADGRVVVGAVNNEAAFWTRAGGVVLLGIPPGNVASEAVAASGDGSVIAITGSIQNPCCANSGWVWTSDTGIVPVTMPGIASVTLSCISRDGSTVGGAGVHSGSGYYQAIVWTFEDGGRLVPQGGNYASWLHALSPTGLRGVGNGSSGQGTWPLYWPSTYTWSTPLGIMPGQLRAYGLGMTPDGTTIVGMMTGAGASENPYVWTPEAGYTLLLPQNALLMYRLTTVSDDGLLAGGASGSPTNSTGILWRKGIGLVATSTYFAAHGITTGPLSGIVGISANGRVICAANKLIDLGPCGSADFNHDGAAATDTDIEAFFACLAGECCPMCDSADFNYDGDAATDQDIEAFFRVLAGGSC
jgi:hypothetical protein